MNHQIGFFFDAFNLNGAAHSGVWSNHRAGYRSARVQLHPAPCPNSGTQTPRLPPLGEGQILGLHGHFLFTPQQAHHHQHTLCCKAGNNANQARQGA